MIKEKAAVSRRTKSWRPCDPSFFDCRTEELARKLLGSILVYDDGQSFLAAKIVETESYLAEGDPACHAARGKTARNAAMFGQAGRSYAE